MMISGIGGSCERFDAGERPSFFKRMDGDGDGRVTRDEMQVALEERAQTVGEAGRSPRGDAPSVDELFAQIDTNGDDAIDEDEDKAFRAKHAAEHLTRQQESLELMRQLLSSLESEQDGSLSSTELAALFGHNQDEQRSTFSAAA